jgi:hypothetical protein
MPARDAKGTWVLRAEGKADILASIMNDLHSIDENSYGQGFIPPDFLLPGETEYRIRDEQLGTCLGRSPDSYRGLTSPEITALVENGNRCRDWGLIRVSERFDAGLVRNSEFAGLVRLGSIRSAIIEHHDLQSPVGITNSRIVACDIGDDCAIHDCAYLAHYIIGDGCVLLSNDEMHVSNHSKFGSGIVMEGESEELRVELDLMNEAGGRSVSPFRGMTSADAYLWARNRGDEALLAAFRSMTDAMFDHRRGRYGTVGRASVLKSNRIIKDVAFGEASYIKGANKLKNLTILSSDAARTQIGEGVELVNGIVGYGSRVFYGCKAVRFLLGTNCSLKYGARLIHSVLGDNSTVSCCEMLNNLIFPGHEQHHNTSFLIAALVRGQSNMAAAATIGSNHNSRAPDGEVDAGRGFWPGLATSVKHSSRFASFCLLSKGDYRFELDLRLPFCLVDDDRCEDKLVLAPAYWWSHNLYALMRNEGKLHARDKRVDRSQALEYSPFAPDTAEEMIEAIGLIEGWAAAAGIKPGEEAREIELPKRLVENSERAVALRKPGRSIAAYREMLLWYAGNTLVSRLGALRETGGPREPIEELDAATARGEKREREWENLGGQLVPMTKLEAILAKARTGGMRDWNDMHAEYARLSADYPEDKARHAWATLRWLYGSSGDASVVALRAMDELEALAGRVEAGVFDTRAKDYENRFRKATFRSEAERLAVSGSPEDNAFVKKTRTDMATLRNSLAKIRSAL